MEMNRFVQLFIWNAWVLLIKGWVTVLCIRLLVCTEIAFVHDAYKSDDEKSKQSLINKQNSLVHNKFWVKEMWTWLCRISLYISLQAYNKAEKSTQTYTYIYIYINTNAALEPCVGSWNVQNARMLIYAFSEMKS